jgi:hypothetical protein
MIDTFDLMPCCNPSFQFDNKLSVYESLCALVTYVNNTINLVNQLESGLAVKENSLNITNSRKLDNNGNFTGMLSGNKVSDIITLIVGNDQQIKYLVDQFETGQTGLVIDGGYFEDEEINKNYDGGVWL